jgi:bifunctional ADP-heptose synthase (sugar kinase/adenylyltransferase)
VGAADTVSAIVLSDYAKGVLQPALIERVVAIAKGGAFQSSSIRNPVTFRAMRAPRF